MPANSPASTVTLSAPLAQACQAYIFTRSRYQYVYSGATTVEPEQFASVPPNLALCPASVNPLPQMAPATPTAVATVTGTVVPAVATPTPQPVVLVAPAVVPQVFQNPAAQGIFNGPRNSATPRPAGVQQVAPAALPVLRPPSTGDGGLQ